MDEQVFEDAAGSAPAAEAVGNPFMALIERAPVRKPVVPGITVVRAGRVLRPGQRITARGMPPALDDDEVAQQEAAVAKLRRERSLAYYRARYQRLKADPADRARRKAWNERNKEWRIEYQKTWRSKNREARKLYKAAWQRRKLLTDEAVAEAHREANRAYYAANRERILAMKKAQRAEAKRQAGKGGA